MDLFFEGFWSVFLFSKGATTRVPLIQKPLPS